MPETPTSGSTGDPGLDRVNALSSPAFREEFARCLNVDRWVAALDAERPFGSRRELLAAAEAHASPLTVPEVEAALSRHPRIGEKASGGDTESRWSRGEQAAVTAGGDSTEQAFKAANAAYEERFGHIYLVCASGRSPEDLLGDLEARLDNDPEREKRVVGEEFRKIALLRVEKVLDEA